MEGVYVVEAYGLGEQAIGGVANIGQRPTVNGVRQQLEVHLFDFHGDLYGKQLEVALLHKLRDEKKFESFDALKQQIELDAEAARVVRWGVVSVGASGDRRGEAAGKKPRCHHHHHHRQRS